MFNKVLSNCSLQMGNGQLCMSSRSIISLKVLTVTQSSPLQSYLMLNKPEFTHSPPPGVLHLVLPSVISQLHSIYIIYDCIYISFTINHTHFLFIVPSPVSSPVHSSPPNTVVVNTKQSFKKEKLNTCGCGIRVESIIIYYIPLFS